MSVVEIAACLVMFGYVFAFLVLTRKASLASGTSVWLFAIGRERQGIPAALFRLAFILGIALPPISERLAAADYWFFDGPDLPSLVRFIGLSTMVLGAVVALHAQNYMGTSWRIGAAEGRLGAIVDTGPFRLSRNPVFVGQAVLFVGSLMVFPNIPQAAIVAGLLVAIHLQVRIEERVLSRELGDIYATYVAKVPRWL